MDLIELYEAASLVGAENVDSGKLSEAEYKLQLAELRTRMTAEDQRRRVTMANTQAAQLQAQAATTQANVRRSASPACSPRSPRNRVHRRFNVFFAFFDLPEVGSGFWSYLIVTGFVVLIALAIGVSMLLSH
jgi:hypothetical protein